MSLTIEGVYVEEQSVPDIFMFEFSDGEYVGLQKNTADRHSEYDGALYSAWFTTAGTIVNDPDETDVSRVPDKVADRDIYWVSSDSDSDGSEYIELIQEFVR